MRRLLRLGFSVAAVVSVVLFAGVCIAWAESWAHPSCLSGYINSKSPAVLKGGSAPEREVSFYSMRGGLDARYYWRSGPAAAGSWEWNMSAVGSPQRLSERPDANSPWNRMGFYWRTGRPQGSYFAVRGSSRPAHFVFVGVPYAALAILTIAPPAAWLLRRLRRRIQRRGFHIDGNSKGLATEGTRGHRGET